MTGKTIDVVGIPSLTADSRRVSEIIEMLRKHPKNIPGFAKSLGFKELAGHKLYALEKAGSTCGALVIKQSDNINKIAEIALVFKNFDLSEDDIDEVRQIIEDLLPEYTKIRILVEENDHDIIGILKKISFVYESERPAEIFTSTGYKNAQSFILCTAPDRKIIDMSQEETSSTDDQKKITLLAEKLEKIQEILGNKNIEAGIKALKEDVKDKDAKIRTAANLIKELEREIAELKQRLAGTGPVPEKSDKLSELIAKIGELSDEVEDLKKELDKKQKEIEKLRREILGKGETSQNCENLTKPLREKIAELKDELKRKSDQIIKQARMINDLKNGEKTPEEVPEKTDPGHKTANDNTAEQDQSDGPEKTKEGEKESVDTSESPATSEETLKTDSSVNVLFTLLEERIKGQNLNGFSVANMKKILTELYNKDNQRMFLAKLNFDELGFDFLQAKAMCKLLAELKILRMRAPGTMVMVEFPSDIKDLLIKQTSK